MKTQLKNKHLSIFESAIYRTTSTLFSNEDLTLLVDPNWLPIEIEHIRQAVKSIASTNKLHLLFTHSDYDHIIAWRAFENTTTIASQAFVDSSNKEKQIQDIKDFDDKHYIQRTYPIEYPVIDQVISEEGHEINFGKTKLTFYKAPGHTNDGLFTIVEPYGIWIAGDYLSNVEFPFIYDSSNAYLQTIETMEMILQKHVIKMLIPGHGDATENITEIQQRIVDSKNYILELRNSIQNQTFFDKEKWLNHYPYPKFTEQAHVNNVALIADELERGF